MTSTTAMEAGSASVERLLAAAAATMEKARYCWAMTVAEDGADSHSTEPPKLSFLVRLRSIATPSILSLRMIV